MVGERLRDPVIEEVISPVQPDLRVDFVRHGTARYSRKDVDRLTIEGWLPKLSKKQVRTTAISLASNIDKENELVVFWVSPKRRARETTEIFEEVFKKKGISVHKTKTVTSLRDLYYGHDLVADYKSGKVHNLIEYWLENIDYLKDAEKPENVKKRVEIIVTYLERIARMIAPVDNKSLRFICVGHEELFRDLLEEGFGWWTKYKKGPENAEVMGMDIFKSQPGKNALLKLTFRGQVAELGFNPQKREFHKLETL